jgi:hypothetical protein
MEFSNVYHSIDCGVSGAITDNTATIKVAWKRLKVRYKRMLFHGCVSHGLHLLVKDIFLAKKTKCLGRNFEPNYPEGYPFPQLQEFKKYCKDIVVFFKNHHTMHGMLKVSQKNTKPQCRVLVLPAAT